jgi:hypothetical protein
MYIDVESVQVVQMQENELRSEPEDYRWRRRDGWGGVSAPDGPDAATMALERDAPMKKCRDLVT